MNTTQPIVLYTPEPIPSFAAQFVDLVAAQAVATIRTYTAATVAAGLRALEQAAPAAIVAWTFLHDENLRRLNRLALERAIPLLFCSSRAGGMQVGPAVVAGRAGCLDCFAQQLALFPAAAPHCARESAAELEPPARPQIERLAADLAGIRGRAGGPLAQGRLIERTPAGERVLRTLANPLCLSCSPYADHPIHMFVTPLPQRG
jgi:hypothetical protein